MSARKIANASTRAGTLWMLAAGLTSTTCATPQAVPPPVGAPTPASAAAAPAPGPAPAPPPPARAAEPVPTAPERQTPDAPFRASAPAPGPEPQFKVPAFKRFKLKSGLEVMLAEMHELPLVDLSLIVKAGGGANPADRPGLADMTANMLDEGTKTRSAIQIADELAQLGAHLGTVSSWDASTAMLSTLSKNLDAALGIWADVVVHPTFSDTEFARVRDNLLTGVARRKDSPPTISALALSRVLYGDRHPFGWPMTGVESSLKTLTVVDVRKFYEDYYHPNNAVFFTAAATTEKDLKAKLEAALKGWQAKGVPKRKLASPPVPSKTKIYLIDKADAPQ